ncbi:MAG: Ig-like domain-containing protein, partial [Polyangiaceae bacterium]|nr:Ig-like domain-containing protein [Polyangiaceae bacterium]
IDVLANDESMVELPLELRIETPPEHGTATIEPDSTITYKPNANYFGDDAFVYGVTDGNGDDVTANVAVSVAAVNDMPVAVDDNASTARDESVEIAVLANDTDVEGDTLAVVSASSPEHGSASIGSAGQIAYTPDTSFEGSDEFQYTVEDSAGAQATATVRVEVGKDTDGDGLCDIHEATLGTDPNNPDTDNDGLADGVEVHSASTNPLDDDTDDDGLLDGNEDAQGTSPLEVDSDGDGLQDGTELGLTQPQGKDTDSGVFVADTDDLSTTDPRDDDTDDDGLTDGTEDENHNGKVDAKETDPSSSDSDRDGILDGTEAGRREPEGSGTDQDVFVPDADPETTTNPVVPDTDQGGKLDGEEDSNHNGRVDPGETDPSDPADDLDPNEFFAGAAPRDEGGCGCRVEAQSYRASIVAALVALAGLMVIRRRRGRASATRG